jgi:formate hydrogenlyase subunit 6/NADH:ubiquinone oxidoreductase subunit I
MKKPGRMLGEVLRSVFKKPATVLYPAQELKMPDKYRGKLSFSPEQCIGCKLCMRDCPTQAITINKVGEKKFEVMLDLSRCIFCAQCVDSCVRNVIKSTAEVELAQFHAGKLKLVYRRNDSAADATKEAG